MRLVEGLALADGQVCRPRRDEKERGISIRDSPDKILYKNRLRKGAPECEVPFLKNAGWSSLVARQAHNPAAAGSRVQMVKMLVTSTISNFYESGS